MFAFLYPLFLLLILLGSIFCLFMIWRNTRVYEYRTRLVHGAHDAYREEIRDDGRYDPWRYHAFERVTYNRMLFQFWRKMDSFYPDKSFLDPKARNHK
jgi:hypothetical protein